MQMRQSSRKRPAKENQRTGAETSAELKMTFISFSPLIFPKSFFFGGNPYAFFTWIFQLQAFYVLDCYRLQGGGKISVMLLL